MATKKHSTSWKKPKTKKEEPQTQIPAVPPPDDPLLRFTEFDADREYHSQEMAEKRLEAIRQTREMPTSEEEQPDAAAPSEQTPSPKQSDSK